MKTGKLDSKLLEEMVFKHFKYKRPEVITGPSIGEDCALVDFGEYDCVFWIPRTACCAPMPKRSTSAW